VCCCYKIWIFPVSGRSEFFRFLGPVRFHSTRSAPGISSLTQGFIFIPLDLLLVFHLSPRASFSGSLSALPGSTLIFLLSGSAPTRWIHFFLYLIFQRPVVGIAWSSACSLVLVAAKIFILCSHFPCAVLDSPGLWSHFLCSRISFLQIQLVFSLEVLPVSIFATQSAGAWGQGFSNPFHARNFSVLRSPVRTGQSKVPLGFFCKSSFVCCSSSRAVRLDLVWIQLCYCIFSLLQVISLHSGRIQSNRIKKVSHFLCSSWDYMIVSQARPQVVRRNGCEDLNWF
jgi:hypothetical protein